MPDWVLTLLSALFSQAPTLMLTIFGFIIALFGTTGVFFGGGKIEKPTRTILLWGGWILFFIFGTITIIQVLITTWSTVEIILSYFSVIGSWIQRLLTWKNFLYLTTIILLAIWTNSKRIEHIERGYRIRTIPVIDKDFHNNRLGVLQVENIGEGGNIVCRARLIGASYKSLRGRLYNEMDVNEINPKGLYLGWGTKGKETETLEPNIPKFISVLSENNFVFSGMEESEYLNNGYFKIKLDISRLDKKTDANVKFSTFEEILKMTDNNLEWIEIE